jgi:hypothetical protein
MAPAGVPDVDAQLTAANGMGRVARCAMSPQLKRLVENLAAGGRLRAGRGFRRPRPDGDAPADPG